MVKGALRGSHFSGCFHTYPACLCLRCANDGCRDESGWCCCEKHKHFCDDEPCPDFVQEEEGEIDV